MPVGITVLKGGGTTEFREHGVSNTGQIASYIASLSTRFVQGPYWDVRESVPASTGNMAQGSNAPIQVVYGAAEGHQNTFTKVLAGYNMPPSGGYLTFEDGSGNVVNKFPIIHAGIQTFDNGDDSAWRGSYSTATLIRLTGGGAFCSGFINVMGYRLE